MKGIAQQMREIAGLEVKEHEPLAPCTSLRVGGRARLFLAPRDVHSARSAVEKLVKMGVDFCVLGNGTNLLVSDRGTGVVLSLARLGGIKVERDEGGCVLVSAGAGVSLRRLLVWCCRKGLSGLEGLAGIPASIGGAVFMNAGANGTSIADTLHSLDVIEGGTVTRLPAHLVPFSYRDSGLHGKVVVKALFRLRKADPSETRQRIREVMERRLATQPLGKPSAGCAFKNPPGDSAGRLIDAVGLKGARVGGAMVSPKHANFIVNEGGATAADILALMDRIKREVVRATGTQLQPEITVWG